MAAATGGLTPEQIIAVDGAHLWHPYSSIGREAVSPVVAVAAHGAWLTLIRDGQPIEVLDAMSSWWTAIHGHGHPALDQALTTQLRVMNHVMFGGLTHEPAARLAKLLVDITPAGLDTVFFSDSGSVSVEVAAKMALQYWRGRGLPGKRRLMTWRGGYHGDTFLAMSICDPHGGMHSLWTDVLAAQVFAPQVPRDYDPAYSAAFGRFEAEHPNALWTGDVLHGIRIDLRKTYLFAFLDDHSRLVPGYRWGHAEDTVRLAAALRPALASRGVPNAVYVDNGSPYVDAWLLQACAKLGVRLVHSTPGRPQGRGKIERFFRTVREQFLVEITGEPDVVGRHYVADLAELNRLFTAWVETVYHRSVHSETGQTPLARWSAGGPIPLPAPETLTEAFLWEEHRRVTKTATVSLHGNRYEIDPALVGRKVELVFDPFDLTRIEVRLAGAPMGRAIPYHIGRHSHPKAKPETPTAPPKPSGIDYAQLIETAHAAELARGVNYTALTGAADQIPGQLDLLTGQEAQPK